MPAPDQNEPSVQGPAKIDRAAAEQATLKAVPGTVRETELEEANGPGDTKTLIGEALLKTLIEECPRLAGRDMMAEFAHRMGAPVACVIRGG